VVNALKFAPKQLNPAMRASSNVKNISKSAMMLHAKEYAKSALMHVRRAYLIVKNVFPSAIRNQSIVLKIA
jgi:hypothetical protein